MDDSWKCIRSNIDATASGLAQATHTFTTENMPEKYSFSGCCSATSNDYGGIYISTVPHTFTRAEITSGATPDGGFWLYRNNGYGAPVTKVSEQWLEPNTAYHVHFVYSKYSSSFANQNALVINNICRHVYLEGE